MRRTLQNLEREESAIVAAYKQGEKLGGSMREHLNNIRKHALYQAIDGCDNFSEYVKLQRLPMESAHAYKIAANGETAGYLENSLMRELSERALEELSRLRVDKTDEDGNVIGKTHDIDATKVRRVGRKLSTKLSNGEKVTAAVVRQLIADTFANDKPSKPLGKILQAEKKRIEKMHVALDQLDWQVFVDAEEEYENSVSALARAYSKLASLLKEALR